MQAAGKIRHIGLSNVGVEQIRAARQIAPIVSVQNLYNLVNRCAESVLVYCEREGIGLIPWLLRRSPVMLPIPGTSSLDHVDENVAAARLELSDEQASRLKELG
jgi:pyridoxine 4-dehydrogenase